MAPLAGKWPGLAAMAFAASLALHGGLLAGLAALDWSGTPTFEALEEIPVEIITEERPSAAQEAQEKTQPEPAPMEPPPPVAAVENPPSTPFAASEPPPPVAAFVTPPIEEPPAQAKTVAPPDDAQKPDDAEIARAAAQKALAQKAITEQKRRETLARRKADEREEARRDETQRQKVEERRRELAERHIEDAQRKRDEARKQAADAARRDRAQEPRTRVASAAPSPASPARDARPATVDSGAYKMLVASKIAAAKFFPEAARARGAHGRPTVSFQISASGQVSGVSLSASSGDSELDAAAVATVRRAAPFPPSGAPRSFSIPLNYSVR